MAGELAELSRQLTDLSQAIEDHQANPGHRFTRPYQAGRTHDRRAAPTRYRTHDPGEFTRVTGLTSTRSTPARARW
jgi:hypothetical protein